ncbi:MAG: hypothetical protein ACRC5A_14495 [Enterobacteriaceae bacterium]
MSLFRHLFLISLLLFSGTVYAEMEGCNLLLTPASVDYGKLTHAKIRKHSANHPTHYTLEKREITLQVICTQPRKMAVSFHSPALEDASYKFGRGRVQLIAHSALLDDKPAQLRQDENGQPQRKLLLIPNKTLFISRDNQEESFQRLVLPIEIQTFLPIDTTRIRDLEEWELRGQFELVSY